MKKYLSLLLVALLLFAFLVSCSTSQNGNNANSSDSGVAQDSSNQSETNIDSSTTDSSQTPDVPPTDTSSQIDENLNNQDILDTLIPNEKTVCELRNEKVSFDLDYHEIGEMLEKEEIDVDSTKHYFGYIGTNESGNEYIIYAPNVYSYYVSIKCTDDFSGVESVISKIEFDYFDRGHTGSNDEMHIDTVQLFDNEILVVFPDFDSYALCQDELLNKLSELDSVSKIKVSYLNIQDGSDVVENPYEYINLGYYYKLKEENRLFSTYKEFCEAFADGLSLAEKLDVITAETFENNYVFMIISTYSGDTYGFDISDARLDGNRVFFTTNKYIKSGLHDMWLATDYCIVLVPKEELGELPNDISSVIDMQVGVYIDSSTDKTK